MCSADELAIDGVVRTPPTRREEPLAFPGLDVSCALGVATVDSKMGPAEMEMIGDALMVVTPHPAATNVVVVLDCCAGLHG